MNETFLFIGFAASCILYLYQWHRSRRLRSIVEIKSCTIELKNCLIELQKREIEILQTKLHRNATAMGFTSEESRRLKDEKIKAHALRRSQL